MSAERSRGRRKKSPRSSSHDERYVPKKLDMCILGSLHKVSELSLSSIPRNGVAM